MPFFMVRAGKGFFDPSIAGKRTRRPARVPPSIVDPVSRPQSPTSLHLSTVNHGDEGGDANKPVECENGQHILHISYHLFSTL